jgi:hypothetical protein
MYSHKVLSCIDGASLTAGTEQRRNKLKVITTSDNDTVPENESVSVKIHVVMNEFFLMHVRHTRNPG